MNNIKTFENFNKQGIFTYIDSDDIQLVKNYINSGYDLNIQDNYGDTPLIFASRCDNIEIFKLLLNYGASINEQNKRGNTALIRAAYNNNCEIVELLLNAGANINVQNVNGSTPLIAASSGNIEVVKLLLNAGADIDKQDENGYTALIHAAYENNKEIVELLLDYHADEFILTNNDDSFYDYLTDENKQYFLKEYPNKVYNAIYHDYKKSFTEFVKDYKIKNFY